jgi:DNA-binding CsgD family transcriptional regulator
MSDLRPVPVAVLGAGSRKVRLAACGSEGSNSDIAAGSADTAVMGAGSNAQLGRVVGRAAEERVLSALLDAAASGEPGAVFVHGEAGVGKTALVREVCGRFAGEVLWGTCVHFGAASVPFTGLASALGGWASGAGDEARNEVFAGLDALRALLPGLGSGEAGDRELVLPQLDTALVRVARRSPTVLVIDDLQWADPSSLDLLAFLISGFHDQRLAVVATVRDEDRPEGHPLNSWLAEVRRLPGVYDLYLERLGPQGTAEQVAALTGGTVPSPALAAGVHARSGGNPYLTELLMREDPLGTSEPGASVSEALREALLSRWHGLSGRARQSTRLLAIGGRPVALDVLETVAALVDPGWVDGPAVRESVAEAVAAGVLERPRGGWVWFRHPLIAEVLTMEMAAPDPAPVHSAYAKALAVGPCPEPGDLACHHELAGELTEAFRWSLVAADSAASAQGEVERLEHLQRACHLWPQVMGSTEPVSSYVQLLLRTAVGCLNVNRPQDGLDLLEQALSLTDRSKSPDVACRLLTLKHRMLVEAQHLSFGAVTPPLREALALAESLPGTTEHVIVTVAFAWTQVWSGSPGLKERASAALKTARQVGSPEALTAALNLSAAVSPASVHALDWATEAYKLAAARGDVVQMADAAAEIHNQLEVRGQNAAGAEADATHGRELILAGSPPWGHFLLTCAGMFALWLGQWQQAEDYLRPALASANGGHHGGVAHSTMAVLCIRRGDQSLAEQHLAWAEDVGSTDYRGSSSYPYAQVELLLAQRRPARALRVIEGQIGASSLGDPRDADEFLVLAARAAADLGEQGGDQHRDDATETAEAALRRVMDAWSSGATESFIPWDPADLVQPARKALHAAELARLRDLPDQSRLWAHARDACQQAGMLWEEAVAAFRQGQTALAEGLPRAEAAQPLRHALGIADKLGARPLRRDIDITARTSHIRLDPVAANAPAAAPTNSQFTELTPREREVLAQVIAGRSNGEIAKALFISDKTVSSHVSNILRKSGTSTRGAAAAWASRVTQEAL